MVSGQPNIDELLSSLPPRSFRSTLFNIANAYARAADLAWNEMGASRNADFAGPAIVCQSFAVELLLKFFIAADHPEANTVDELENAGAKLRCHKLSELFDQLQKSTKEKIAAVYSKLSGEQSDAEAFRATLLAQGDDPFVYWRYIYERVGNPHLDPQAFNLVTDALGKAAEAVMRAATSPGNVEQDDAT